MNMLGILNSTHARKGQPLMLPTEWAVCWAMEQMEQWNSWNSRFLYYSPPSLIRRIFLMILLFHLFHWLCTYKIPPEYKTECH